VNIQIRSRKEVGFLKALQHSWKTRHERPRKNLKGSNVIAEIWPGVRRRSVPKAGHLCWRRVNRRWWWASSSKGIGSLRGRSAWPGAGPCVETSCMLTTSWLDYRDGMNYVPPRPKMIFSFKVDFSSSLSSMLPFTSGIFLTPTSPARLHH